MVATLQKLILFPNLGKDSQRFDDPTMAEMKEGTEKSIFLPRIVGS
jgi:hypothetical protein